MSLINEALKKAQKQRTGEAPTLSSLPSIGGERPVQIARRTKPAGFNTLLLRLGLGLGGLAVLIVGGVWLFRGDAGDGAKPAAPVAAAPAPAVASPPASETTAPAPVAAPPAPSPSVSTFVVPNVTPGTPAPAAPIQTAPAAPVPRIEPAKPVAVAPAPVVEVPKPEPAAPPPRLEARAINFIESIRVAGIRASATDSKVLMNDRVYRIGNIVEAEMGLRLVEITSSSLTFEDERGGRYTRNF